MPCKELPIRPIACLLALFPVVGHAMTHGVERLTRGETGAMVYVPACLEIASCDTVPFLPVQRGHNTASIPEMLPDGAERFIGQIGEEFAMTSEVEGRCGIRCSPHCAMGMVMIADVGDVDDAAPLPDAVPDRARQRRSQLLGR